MDLIELPIVCTGRVERPVRPEAETKTVLITGAAGTVGTIASRVLFGAYRLIAFDLVRPANPELFAEIIQGSVSDRELVMEAVLKADFVLHFSAGAPQGWKGLSDSELSGSRNVIDAAMRAGTKRIVLASSNHIAGWYELDQLAGVSKEVFEHTLPLRPDGLYAATKAFVEALGRSAAEYSGLPVSILRIGTMRVVDDPRALSDDPAFSYIGTKSEVTARMQKTWLYHGDFERILTEELKAVATFRLRFAVSGNDSPWTTDVQEWDR